MPLIRKSNGEWGVLEVDEDPEQLDAIAANNSLIKRVNTVLDKLSMHLADIMSVKYAASPRHFQRIVFDAASDIHFRYRSIEDSLEDADVLACTSPLHIKLQDIIREELPVMIEKYKYLYRQWSETEETEEDIHNELTSIKRAVDALINKLKGK